MDIWSKRKRSEVMSKIKSKNTKPELILRKELFKMGYRFRIHDNTLPGKPDIKLPKYNTVIFVHGCFWHFHKKCKEGRIPSSNSEFWKIKLERNITNDKKNIRLLRKQGWIVLVVWECEIEKKLNLVINKIEKSLSILRQI